MPGKAIKMRGDQTGAAAQAESPHRVFIPLLSHKRGLIARLGRPASSDGGNPGPGPRLFFFEEDGVEDGFVELQQHLRE